MMTVKGIQVATLPEPAAAPRRNADAGFGNELERVLNEAKDKPAGPQPKKFDLDKPRRDEKKAREGHERDNSTDAALHGARATAPQRDTRSVAGHPDAEARNGEVDEETGQPNQTSETVASTDVAGADEESADSTAAEAERVDGAAGAGLPLAVTASADSATAVAATVPAATSEESAILQTASGSDGAAGAAGTIGGTADGTGDGTAHGTGAPAAQDATATPTQAGALTDATGTEATVEGADARNALASTAGNPADAGAEVGAGANDAATTDVGTADTDLSSADGGASSTAIAPETAGAAGEASSGSASKPAAPVDTAGVGAAAMNAATNTSAHRVSPQPAPGTAPEAAAVATQTGFDMSKLGEGIAGRIRNGDRVQTLSLQLHPAELGGVRIDVRQVEGVTHMVLTPDNPTGGQRLAAALADLRHDLDRAGVNIGDLQLRQDSAGSQQGHSRDGQGAGDAIRSGAGHRTVAATESASKTKPQTLVTAGSPLRVAIDL